MAIGFKVADAYVAVHTEDDTKRGREKIGRDSEQWSSKTGDKMGGNLARGFMRGLMRAFGFITTLTMMVSKLALLGLAAGAAATAVAGLLGYIVQLLPVVAQLATALVTAAGALLLIPGVIATLVTAVLTLKLGFQGLGTALKAGLAGDVEALNEALKKLAPNAAEFVQEVIKIKPAFDRVRLQIQNSLFADLANMLRRMAEVYLPIINDGLDRMAQVINKVFRGIGEFLLGANTQNDIATILSNAATAAGNLATALEPALEILRDVLVVSTGVFAEISNRVRPIFLDWADTIARMRDDGSLAAIITDGLGAIQQFLLLAGDLLGILRGIFKAAGGVEGGGLFGFFDKLNTLINSASGQTALTGIFDALGKAADALTPVLLVLLEAIVPLLYAISTIAVAMGPSLTTFVQKLGEALLLLLPGFLALIPLLTVVGDAFEPLAVIISDLVVGMAPYLEMFLTLFVDLLNQLKPLADPVGRALGLLVLVLGDLFMVLAPLLIGGLDLLAKLLINVLGPLDPLIREMLPQFNKLWKELFKAIEPLLPVIAEFMFALVQQFIQHLPELIPLFAVWVELLARVAMLITGEVIQALEDMIPLLPDLIASGLEFAKAMTALAVALTPLIVLFIKIMGDSGQVQLSMMVLTGIVTGLAWAIEATAKVISNWITFFGKLISAVMTAINWLGDFFDQVKAGWRIVSDAFGSVRDTIINAIAGFNLWDAGRNLLNSLVNGIKAAVPHLDGVMGWIADRVRAFWPFSPAKRGPLSGRGDMKIAGANLVSRLVEGVRSEADAAQAAAEALAGLFGLNGAGAFALAGGGSATAAGDGSRPLYVLVQVGDKPVREMVRGEIIDNPDAVASATDEGHRQAAFMDPSRRRVGSS